jgi:hypothetical protein
MSPTREPDRGVRTTEYDALEPLGVESLDMPLTAETVWSAVRDADEEP